MRILVALAVLAPAAAFANGYHLPIQSPRDLAFGGSGTAAVQNSASAVYANPAALAGLDGFNLAASLELISLSAHWQDITGQIGAGTSVDTVPKATFPPALYVSYGDKIAGRSAAIGAGFTVAGGGLFFWPPGWPGRTSIITVDRKSFAIDVVAAYQPIDMLKVSVGGVYMRTIEKLQEGLDFLSTQGDAQLGAAGGAFSFHLAGELQPYPGLRVGLDYRHKATQDLTGNAHFGHVPPAFAAGAIPLRDQGVSHRLVFPNILQAGVSYQVMPDLLLNVGYLFVRWVVYKEDLFVGLAPDGTPSGLTVQVPHQYHNGFGFTVAGEYKLPPLGPVQGLMVRAGFERIKSPQPSDTIHPAIPDANSTSFCLGLGYRVNEHLDLDIGDKLAILDTSTTTGTQAFPGQYDLTANFLSAGFTYRFGGTSP